MHPARLYPAGGKLFLCCERGLETIDRDDRCRVDAAQHAEVERNQIPEQHEGEDALQRRLPTGVDNLRRVRVGLDQLAREREALLGARMGVAIVEEDRTELAEPSFPPQPTISLWSASGSSCAKAGISAFSFIWVFQR